MSSGPLDICDTKLHRSVRAFARERLLKVANLVKHRMQRFPATGIFGEYEHRHLWHEYRYEVEKGPTPSLGSAWDHTVIGYIDGALLTLAPNEAVLCSVGANWEMDGDQAEMASDPVLDEDALRRIVGVMLYEIADAENCC